MIGIAIGNFIGKGSSGSSWTPQYFNDTIDGGTTYIRKVVRMQGADEVYAVDLRLTDSPGFAGVEDIDFEMIYKVGHYYVSTIGNDANDGKTPTRAFLTLAYACSQVTIPRSIIHVAAGTYTEAVSSVLAVGVSIEGVGITSIIKSGYSDPDEVHSLIVLTSASEGINGNQSISNLKIDGNSLTGTYGICIKGRSNIKIHNCTFVDFSDWGVTFSGRIDYTDAAPVIYATGNEFYNNTITNCSKYATSGRGGLQIGGQDGMLIHDNNLSQTGRSLGTNGYVIKYYLNGYLKEIKIYNNIITKEPYDGSTWDFAIELWNCLGGVEIYDNIITGSIDIAGVSTQKGSSIYAVYIHNNTIEQALSLYEEQSGILLEGNVSDVIISYNHIKNVAMGIQFVLSEAIISDSNINIYYNLIENIGVADGGSLYKGWGIRWNSAYFDNIVDNINIWNNILIGRVSALTENMYGIELPDVGTATNISVRNNVVKDFSYSPVFAEHGDLGAIIDYLSVENNIFYNNGNNNVPRYNNGMTPTHNTTQNNLTSNPLFVSISDFHLQAGSPAINAGVDVGLTSDYEGNPIVGVPDIGAYEKQ